MFYKKLCFVVIASFVLYADARSFRRSKRPRPKPEDDSTPQPNVVTYSTYGFNDVGGFNSYDGFVPSSPDYASQLSNFKQDSETRLYAPAFPTALDHYTPQSQNGQFSLDDEVQKSTHQFGQSSMGFTNNPSQDGELQNQNPTNEIYGRNSGDPTAPSYGTKLSSRGKGKHHSRFNDSDVNLFSSPSDNKYSFHEVQSMYESQPPSFAEASENKYQFAFNYATTHPTSGKDDNDEYLENSQSNSQHNLKFPKVYDFTNLKKYYPNDLFTTTTKAPNGYKSHSNIKAENSFFKEFEELSTKFPSISLSFKDQYKEKEQKTEKENKPMLSYSSTSYGNVGNDFSNPNYLNYPNTENSYKDTKLNLDYKDKYKFNSWPSNNNTSDYKPWKNPVKGYQYSTNYSNMNFEFDISGSKKPLNNSNDEVIPASSNLDFSKYQFPDPDFSSFKKFPAYKGFDVEEPGDGFESLKPQGYKYDPEDYVKSVYSNTQATSGIWGDPYKNPDYSPFKKYKKPQYGEDIGDDIVHIGSKRPHTSKYSFSSKPTEWASYSSHKPYKPTKPSSYNNWNKEVSTRFKSEEDLLGLRTHDTSHPTYLPTFKPEFNSLTSDTDYKKLVEKWRQSYLKAKYADTGANDYEGYSTNMKPIHVPVPKPYSIEVPHPVIVPVPQPYPVRVPMPKPVAVPVVRELTVHIEKPVPYPVVKKIPYPVEKPVPVPVEKEVQVPVIKPYPVPVPHIRPVFHHSRPQEIDTIDEEDDYFPHKESSNKILYAKRVKSSRTRTRRPTRTYERNRRRWPTRRPVERPRRPKSQPSRPYERDVDDFEPTYRDYILHCKKTGNC